MKNSKTLNDLPKLDLPEHAPPPLENELPHRRLARLTREHAELTAKLQELKKTWAARNIKAQACRQPIATPEITHFENAKRELALRLLALQTDIGATNKEVRAHKAERLNHAPPAVKKKSATFTKTEPLKQHREYPIYFLLAAKNELEPRLFTSIERAAKSMLQHALETGVQS